MLAAVAWQWRRKWTERFPLPVRRWAGWEGVVAFRVPGAASQSPGVGVLRTWDTHLFRTLDHLCRISMGRLGALGLAGDRGCRQAAALPSSRLIDACWVRSGATSAVTWIIGRTQSLPSATETCTAIIRSSKHRTPNRATVLWFRELLMGSLFSIAVVWSS